MCDASARGWLVTGGWGRSERAQALHGSWCCTEDVVNGPALLRLDSGLQLGAF